MAIPSLELEIYHRSTRQRKNSRNVISVSSRAFR